MAPKRKGNQAKNSEAEDKRVKSAKGDAVEPEVEDKPKKARKSGTKGKAETSKAAESPVKKPDAKEETKDSEDDPVKSLGDTGKDAEPKKDAKTEDPEDTKDSKKVEPVANPKDVPKGAERDERGRLVYEGFPDFRPTLTPKQVIQAGSFGGIYFNPKGGRKSKMYPDGVKIDASEFPSTWFEGLKDEQFKGTRYNIQLNRYKVKSGQNQAEWEDQGWIKDQDPRGWFQWYCRFVMGRRTDDDERQISRWMGVAGPKGRWKTRLVNTVKDAGGDVDDGSISPVIRQNLLHWAYELTKEDYEELAKGNR